MLWIILSDEIVSVQKTKQNNDINLGIKIA